MKCLYANCANTVGGLTIAVHTAAETRFYGAQIMAERMLELKAPIMQTVVSQEWADWVTGASAKVRAEAAEVKALVLDEKTFWDRLVVMVDIFQPVVRLLRLADCTVPAASKVSALCLQGACLTLCIASLPQDRKTTYKIKLVHFCHRSTSAGPFLTTTSRTVRYRSD